jgi:hypothetical protein
MGGADVKLYAVLGPYGHFSDIKQNRRARGVYEEEEEEGRELDSSERHYGWGGQNISSVLKVPRHCPFVLLVSVSF